LFAILFLFVSSFSKEEKKIREMFAILFCYFTESNTASFAFVRMLAGESFEDSNVIDCPILLFPG